ncbi:MAG: putative kinase [Parcubacteria group bacterium]|nr:putative kinase [Parcubacteria group bacterium]
MSLVIMAIGLPGSGKTTLLTPLKEKYNLTFINRDAIYNEMFGVNSDDRSLIGIVFEETARRLDAAIRNNENILRESIFADPEERRETIVAARASGAERVVGVFIDIDLEVAKDRNQKRERHVRDEVIDWRYLQLCHYPPSIDDGFDAFYTFDASPTKEQLEEFEKKEFGLP